ncbi:hypothetical protein FB45DRAFT_1021369 [Roridomyces roridus]|uniref:F-box domain-containing protein n=1 Tax=Roridomyces roridus TaxID=1738132 RepID=A0AAD7FYV6_9AGAR|nr:hypothetical protein FB45DRAFT_1021369 [Roridomyces roridus]
MVALKSELIRLRAERENVLAKLAAVVYPVLTLPHEITSEVFLRYLDDEPTCNPLVLSSVCSLWRKVALSTPRLWTHLHPRHDWTHVADFLRLWLPRAGALPVDIRLLLPDTSSSGRAACEEIFRILGEHSTQLRVLDLFNYSGGINIPVEWPGPLSSLTKISLSTIHDEISIPSLLDAPQLKEASFSRSSFATVIWPSYLPWNQLTTLRFFHVGIPECLQILEHTPNLELLEFGYNAELEFGFTAPPLLLRHLHTLILRENLGDRIMPFLNPPALRKLRLESAIGYCGHNVKLFVERSLCALTDLYLLVEDMDDLAAFAECLPASPSVRSLEINCRNINGRETMQDMLRLMSKTSSLLPALSSLAISECRTTVQLSWLVDMLAGRMGSQESAQLESFRMSFIERDHTICCEDPNGVGEHRRFSHLLTQLGDMRSKGLKLDIHSTADWFSFEINTKMIEEICGQL